MRSPDKSLRLSLSLHGFSLVELLAVMALAAILLGVGLPALSSMRTAGGFTKDIQQLADVLDFARSHALSKGRPVDVGLRSVNEGIVLVVGEREATGFHSLARPKVLAGARVEGFSPASELPPIEGTSHGDFTQVIRFNGRGEARVRADGVDREVAIQLLPNINGQTPESLKANRAEIVIHGLSGGVSMIRDGAVVP